MKTLTFDQFSGSLELLLNLLSRDELDPGEVIIAPLVDRLRPEEINPASFFESAIEAPLWASLILLKSRSLLPHQEEATHEDFASLEETGQEFIRHLTEYASLDRLSTILNNRLDAAQDRFPRHFPEEALKAPPVTSALNREELSFALLQLEKKIKDRHRFIEQDLWNIDRFRDLIESHLQSGKKALFELLHPAQEKRLLIATLLALLELIKEGRVVIDRESQAVEFSSSTSRRKRP